MNDLKLDFFKKRSEEDYALDMEYALASGSHQEREAIEATIDAMSSSHS